jgi:hypothetical protein
MSMTGNTLKRDHQAPTRRPARATEASVRTPAVIAYFAAVIGLFLVSAVLDSRGFGAQEVWLFVALLTGGYALSRVGTPAAAVTPCRYDDHGGRIQHRS